MVYKIIKGTVMENIEVKQLIDLRTYLIHRYKQLDSGANSSTAVMLQRDTAKTIEESIKRIDKVLSKYVEIK